MKKFRFKKQMVESSVAPTDTNLIWVDKDESTGKVLSMKEWDDNDWKIKQDGYVLNIRLSYNMNDLMDNIVDASNELVSKLKFSDLKIVYPGINFKVPFGTLILTTNDGFDLHHSMNVFHYKADGVDPETYAVLLEISFAASGFTCLALHALINKDESTLLGIYQGQLTKIS